MTTKKIIYWFRQDLRMADNSGFHAACSHGSVLPIYILDESCAGQFKMGGASRVWLYHALKSLDKLLGGHLCIYEGNAQKIILHLVLKNKIDALYFNRAYEDFAISQSKEIKSSLAQVGVDARSHSGALLLEPWEVTKDDGNSYQIFTPFYNKARAVLPSAPELLSCPTKIKYLADLSKKKISLSKLGLLPKTSWHQSIAESWDMSEAGAHEKLKDFLKNKLNGYKEKRDYPGDDSTSKLSPYLHFGQLSPAQVYHHALQKPLSDDREGFIRQLFWREFSYSTLYTHPDLPQKNLQKKFDKFPWQKNHADLKAWQQGCTGYPLVDAGMRELWQTGYMHNRVRMIVGSFLVKNLLIHWHEGEKWFWDCLVDADLANNSFGWQWVAGCGTDSAPYYRIFNPITQGEKFDPDGSYTIRYVPEIARLPKKYLFKPFDAPENILNQAGIKLGHTYPRPIVDLAWSRERALAALASLK